MDEDALIAAVWGALVRLSDADRTTRSYNFWLKLGLEKDKSLLTVNEAMVRAAMHEALADSDIAEFRAFLARLDREAADRQRLRMVEMMFILDAEERTSDW